MFWGPLTLVGGALLTGCFAPAAPACALLCDDDDSCPADLVCNAAGLCAAEGQSCAAGDLPADGGTDACGQLAALADDFSTLDEDRWTPYSVAPAGLQVQAGQLLFALAADHATDQVAGLRSRASFPVAGFDARARVIYANEMASLSLQLHAATGQATAAMVANPTVLKLIASGDGQQSSSNYSWDPDATPWWRVREAQGQLLFAVSADGETWDRAGAIDATALGDQAFIELSGHASTAAEAPRLIGFDELAPLCP